MYHLSMSDSQPTGPLAILKASLTQAPWPVFDTEQVQAVTQVLQ